MCEKIISCYEDKTSIPTDIQQAQPPAVNN